MRFLHPETGCWLTAALAVLAVARWRVRRRFVASTTVRWLATPAYRAGRVLGQRLHHQPVDLRLRLRAAIHRSRGRAVAARGRDDVDWRRTRARERSAGAPVERDRAPQPGGRAFYRRREQPRPRSD